MVGTSGGRIQPNHFKWHALVPTAFGSTCSYVGRINATISILATQRSGDLRRIPSISSGYERGIDGSRSFNDAVRRVNKTGYVLEINDERGNFDQTQLRWRYERHLVDASPIVIRAILPGLGAVKRKLPTTSFSHGTRHLIF